MYNISLPKGTRDFFGQELKQRNYIIDIIKSIFKLFGFQELQTPAFENSKTLLGKYGYEGDKLIFRVLNNGNILEKLNTSGTQKQLIEQISDRALRYDLTIPFARFISMNFNKIEIPFKRFQIQSVWRGDRPQKGRYREFTQCDVDIIGSDSLWSEVELISIYQNAFDKLKIPEVVINVNSRKILIALVESINAGSHINSILTTIDKLDKVGIEKINIELSTILNENQVRIINNFLNIGGANGEIITSLGNMFEDFEIGLKGVEELKFLIKRVSKTFNTKVKISPSLVRGLDYYTGLIFEVKCKAVQIGSIGGGGRYDNLAQSMGLEGVSGAGASFGIDRIYDVMEELKLFSNFEEEDKKILFFNLGEQESIRANEIANKLRLNKIPCELYPDRIKLEKQFKYAEKKHFRYVVIIGSREIENKKLKVKDIRDKKEFELDFESLEQIFK